MRQRILILLAFLLVMAVPFVVRSMTASTPGSASTIPQGARRLVIVTPHVEQIRIEFSEAFDRWHTRVHAERAVIDWRSPGGTSEIIKQLEASFDAAARKGLLKDNAFPSGTAPYDLFLGGGSFEHSKMKESKSATFDSKRVTYRMGQPARFDQARLDEWFGDNIIGAQKLYDPEQYWIGTALSGFGIVYNRDTLKQLGLSEPRAFTDLCDPRYTNMLAMTDGRLSGSVTTTYDSILNNQDWDKGWRTLRELCANARYFASAATRPPIDVGQGEAAAALAIDFYGRSQGQVLLRPGQSAEQGRVGYVDPVGAVYVDADPASILNGASDFELAQRFVEFCLTEEAQALWQFHAASDPRSKQNPLGPDARPMGPQAYELRRMPVRRVMYAKYAQYMMDQGDPFKAAADLKQRGWRSLIGPLMAAFGIDTSDELRAAWGALNRARTQAAASGFPPEVLARMESLFYAMPTHTFASDSLLAPKEILAGVSKPTLDELTRLKITSFEGLSARVTEAQIEGKLAPEIIAEMKSLLARRSAFGSSPATLELNAANFRAIRSDTDSWKDPIHGRRSLIDYTAFFKHNYEQVVQLAKQHGL